MFSSIFKMRRSARRAKTGVLLITLCAALLVLAAADAWALIDLPVFGPKRYDRLKGKPTVYTDTFGRCEPSNTALLRVANGDSKRTRIKSGRVYINGAKVASEKDFKHKVPVFEKSITVRELNDLKIVLKSGHHGYLEKLVKYQAKQSDLEQELQKFEGIRRRISLKSSASEIEAFFRDISNIAESHKDQDASFERISRSLDDDDDDDDADSSRDDEPEMDSWWPGRQKADLKKLRQEVGDTIRECGNAGDNLDRVPLKRKDGEHDRKKQALDELARVLRQLDKTIAKTIERIDEIEKKTSEIRNRPPSFIIVEIIGTGCDSAAPVISDPGPADGSLLSTATPRISIQYSDEPAGSGIDIDTVRMTVDGTDVTASASVSSSGAVYTPSANLPEGTHTVTVSVADRARNQASLAWQFTIDTIAPVVKITSHQNDGYVNTPVAALSGSIDDSTASVMVNGRPALNNGSSFALSDLQLVEGTNTIRVEAKDPAGNTGSDGITLNLDTILPVITIATPAEGSFVNIPTITISGTVTEINPDSLWINDTLVPLASGSFSLDDFQLAEGLNTITVRAADRAGNESTATVNLTLDTVAPAILINAPVDGSFANTPAITVTGTVTEVNPEMVWMNGAEVQLLNGSFTHTVTLAEGLNTITVRARDKAGNESTKTVTPTLDTIVPVVTIESPVNDLLTKYPGTAVSGNVSEEFTSVKVNTIGAIVTGQAYSLSSYTVSEGQNTLIVSATDRAGNTGTASVNVTLDSTAPNAPVITPLPTPSPTPVITVSGTAEAGSRVTVSVEKAGSGPAVIGTVTALDGTFSIADIALAEGINTFTATATDAAGNTSETSAPVSVEKDTKPPVITVTAPANNAFTNQTSISVTGNVDEPVELKINGAAVTMDGLSFTHTAALTVGSNFIVISAKDLSGNAATANWVVYVDQTPPSVTITSPADGLLTRTSPIPVSGIVSEASTTVSVNGIPAVVTSKSFSLANFVLSEGQNTLTAVATDRAGNTGTATAGVFLDTLAPSVTVTAPSEAAAGANIAISSESADNVGISIVEILVNGSPVWSSPLNAELSTKNAFVYRVSADAVNGSALTIQAKAHDTAGNIGMATTQVQITSGPTGPGYLQGEVYDDSKGLLLGGATALVAANGRELTRMTTLEDGSYYTEAEADTYLVTLSKPGFTSVERTVTVKSEKDSVAIDARLTPINGQQNLIDANGGTAKAGSDADERRSAQIELSVPANTLVEQTDIRVTPISNQGLAGLLPTGWSPIGIVDIRAFTAEGAEIAEGIVFALQGASLKVPTLSSLNLSPSSSVSLVKYDKTVRQWVVQNPGTVTSDSAFILAPIPSTGQYALVVPDDAASPAVPGSPLSALSASSAVDGVTATGRVVPPAAPAAAGLKAIGEIVISSASSTLHSGSIITGKVTERFDLLSGEVVLPSDYTQDLILYRYPCINSLTANERELTQANSQDSSATSASSAVKTTFPVTPSREYTIIDLMKGKVGIEISLRSGEDSSGTMVGTEGARLLDNDGNVLVIDENSLTKTVPVETRTIPASTLAGVVGPDFTLLRAVDVNLSNQTLAGSAELSIPAPPNVSAALPIVVAKAIEVRGVKKLKLVALAKLSGSLVTSFAAFAPLREINSSGLYLFLQAKSALGFATGIVKDGTGKPYIAAQVTTSTCSLTDLTGPDGRYMVASTVAGFTLTASDIYKNDKGTRIDLITAPNETKTLDVTINVTPPSVSTVSPENGATGVDPKTQIVITMSEPVKPESVTTNTVILKDSTGDQVQGVFSLNPEGTEITFYPAANLKSETAYTLTVTHSIQDLQSYFMGQDHESHFTTKDTTPPPMPPAGSITAGFPDAEGYITITATQGSADPTGTVLIINDTTGEIVSVKPASNGSFTGRIMAMLGDEIKIVSMDAAGNQTLITYITFKSDDGRYLVTAKGGIVEGDGGLRLEVPEGALPGPTVVKITLITEDQLPLDNPVPPQAKFLAAVNIDTGGVNFQKEVKISVPKPSNMPADAVPFVAQPKVHTNADGTQEKVYVIHDSAKVVTAPDGERLTTASPPFTGVWGFGIFSFLYPAEPLLGPVIISGYTYQDMDDAGGYLAGVDKPIAGAVIRDPAAYNFISYSDSDGHYAAYGFSAAGVCRTFATTAIHPQTMYKNTANITTCDVPYIVNNLNFKLADKNTQLPDRIPPAIDMNLQVVPGQENDPRFVAGTIPVGTNLSLVVNIQEQVQAPAPTATLQVSYKTPDMVAAVPVTGNVLSFSGEPTLVTPGSGTTPPTYRFEFRPTFSSTIAGDSSLYFRPPLDQPATYTLAVEATDSAGNRSTRTMTVRAILPGTQPDGVDGPPQVDEIVPADGAEEIMVTMPVMITFNEPVQNVNEETVKLFSLDYDPNTDQTYENPVDAAVYTSLEGGRVRATLQPRTNMVFGKTYKIVVTTDITDSAGNSETACQAHDLSLHEGCFLPLNKQYQALFTTKVPQIYDLADGQFTGGRGIDLYADPNSGKTYAYVTAGDQGYRIIDVTDPTSPTVVKSFSMSNGGVNWNYRGVDVDQDRSMLAMTEDIRYLDGNQYGYVRFYDLVAAGPANPKVVARERLAEAYTGVPIRLSLMNNFAYIATVNIGLQVVDIQAAKDFMLTGQLSDGSSIVGIFDTWGKGYRNPTDILAYKSGKAAMTTTSGHLVLLDINVPQFPQEMTAFKPEPGPNNYNYDSAWRVAVAPDYAYTAAEGTGQGAEGMGTNVIDLAVTVSMQGRIHTVNITDPYNIEVMGVAKDGSDEVIAQASDITISKNSGLVYITSGMSVYIIDIKDPNNPKLLNIVTATPIEPGSADMMPLGVSMALVEKDGWVYLANQDKGFRTLDLDPVYLKQYCDDGEFQNVSRQFCNDYYPALAVYNTNNTVKGKIITLQGFNANYGPLDAPAKVKLTEVKITGTNTDISRVKVYPKNATSPCTEGQITDGSCITTFDKGLAYFSVATVDGFNATDSPYINLRFEVDLSAYSWWQQMLLQTSLIPGVTSMDAYITTVQMKVRDNSNVTLKEVLDGKAVFARDDGNSKGLSDPAVTDDSKRMLSFAQELLNQVVPRKRDAASYVLIEENGIFNADMEKAIKLYREKFNPNIASHSGVNADGVRIANSRINFEFVNGVVEYEPAVDVGPQINDNTTDTFRKLMKDYNHRTVPDSQTYLHRVIDKETLVGAKDRFPSFWTFSEDNQLNTDITNERKDTGLYELHRNVVEKFVNKMIEEGDLYRNSRGSDANTSWISRPTGTTTVTNTESVSYCYGCKNTYGDFWNMVTSCAPPAVLAVSANYSGNLNDAGCGLNGSKRYPGLHSDETNTAIQYYAFDYWTGIDCAGFVQRTVMAAKKLAIPGVNCKIKDLTDADTEWVNHLDDGGHKSSEFLVGADLTVHWNNPATAEDSAALQKKLRKGDLVGYPGHISTIYSDRPTCSNSSCTYEIIHASGDSQICYRRGRGQRDHCDFNRKVITNSVNDRLRSGTYRNPTGFGRIKLWD